MVDKEKIFSIYAEHVNGKRVSGWRRVTRNERPQRFAPHV